MKKIRVYASVVIFLLLCTFFSSYTFVKTANAGASITSKGEQKSDHEQFRIVRNNIVSFLSCDSLRYTEGITLLTEFKQGRISADQIRHSPYVLEFDDDQNGPHLIAQEENISHFGFDLVLKGCIPGGIKQFFYGKGDANPEGDFTNFVPSLNNTCCLPGYESIQNANDPDKFGGNLQPGTYCAKTTDFALSISPISYCSSWRYNCYDRHRDILWKR